MALRFDDPLAVYRRWRIRQEDCDGGVQVRDDLQDLLHQTDRSIEVLLRGSCLSRIGVRDGDVDVTLISKSGYVSLFSVATQIRGSDQFEIVRCVFDARVPIIVAKHIPTGRQLDISRDGEDSVAMAHLLRALADLNPLLEPMIVYLKVWAKERGLIDAKNNYFSGFIFTLMAVFHQQQKAGMAAIALAHGSWSEPDIRRLAATKQALRISVTSANLRAQLRDFFTFYANFNYRRVIDIRTGCTGNRMYGWSKYDVTIAHPVDGTSSYNCAAFIRSSQLLIAKQAFRRAAQRM